MRLHLGLSSECLDGLDIGRFHGVGLVRSEYICRLHEEYVTLPSCRHRIQEYLGHVCREFAGKDVMCRTTEFITPEINVLRGCDVEVHEKQPGYGTRGIRRSLEHPHVFKMELQNLVDVSNQFPNLGIILPFVTLCAEVLEARRLLKEMGYKGKLAIMAEIPTVLLDIGSFLDCGVDQVLVGMNDLTTCVTGSRRGSKWHTAGVDYSLRLVESALPEIRRRGTEIRVGGYLSSETVRKICGIGIEDVVVNYCDLGRVIGMGASRLPYLNRVKEIKAITSKRRNEKEVEDCRRFILENESRES